MCTSTIEQSGLAAISARWCVHRTAKTIVAHKGGPNTRHHPSRDRGHPTRRRDWPPDSRLGPAKMSAVIARHPGLPRRKCGSDHCWIWRTWRYDRATKDASRSTGAGARSSRDRFVISAGAKGPDKSRLLDRPWLQCWNRMLGRPPPGFYSRPAELAAFWLMARQWGTWNPFQLNGRLD